MDVTIGKDMEEFVELCSVCCAGCFIFFLQEGRSHVVADLFSLGFNVFQSCSQSLSCTVCDMEQDYFLGFFFTLDCVSTASLILDLTWVPQPHKYSLAAKGSKG